MRGGAALLVIQVMPAPPGSSVSFNCEQSSSSGALANNHSATTVLHVMVKALESTLAHYRQLLEAK